MQQVLFRTETEIDIFLKKYICHISDIEAPYGKLLSKNIKEDIREMEVPDFENGFIGLMVPRFRYVIRREDLPILESLFDGLKTAAGANFFMAVSKEDLNKSWAAAIGLFCTLYKLYKNIRNKGKVLPALEFQILLCLKNYPEGLELNYLRFLLAQNDIILSEEELTQLLLGLNKVYMQDGSKKELVIMEGSLYRAKGL